MTTYSEPANASTNGSPLLVASFSQSIASPDSLSSSVPLFYGWFFNESTAESISIIGKKYFLAAYDKIPEFQQFINQLMHESNVTNPLEYYVKPLDPDSGMPDLKYHTTAKFCGRNDSGSAIEECVKYLDEVGPYVGRPYRIHFVGLFFTKNTYGIRVKLTADEQKLFKEDVRENSAQQAVGLESEPNNEIDRIAPADAPEDGNHFSYEPYYHIHNQLSGDKENINEHFYPGITFRPQKQNFHPTESRAHLTLGCAPGILAVQTGLDLLNIIDLEVSSFATHQDFSVGGGDIPKATLREIEVTSTDEDDDGREQEVVTAFVLYPEEEMIADSIFDAYL